ncbi:MAG: GNAT family N-acetyltransferase [Pirellulales bacterium]
MRDALVTARSAGGKVDAIPTDAASEPYEVDILAGGDALVDQECSRVWGRLAGAPDGQSTMFRSPEWLAHCQVRSPDASHYLVAIYDRTRALVGAAPLARGRHVLEVSVKFHRLWRASLRCARLFGGDPWPGADERQFDVFFRALGASYADCDCIVLPMLEVDGACWRYLRSSASIREKYFVYQGEAPCKYRTAVLPPKFADYLTQFNAKHRETLRRKLKRLRNRGDGNLELERFEAARDVERFLDLASKVERGSWQHRWVDDRIENSTRWRHLLADAADRGLLLCYVLSCKGEPCAFVLGYRHQLVYHYVQVGYDQSFREYSPGTVILYLLIEDLIERRGLKLLSFGFGDHQYKEAFGNACVERADVLLLTRTLPNRLRLACHSALGSAASGLKWFLRAKFWRSKLFRGRLQRGAPTTPPASLKDHASVA